MAGLVDDILACLQGAGGGEHEAPSCGGGEHEAPSCGGGRAGSGTGGGYPIPWLLCDLRELLPPDSRLEARLRSDETDLCKQLDLASRGDAVGQQHAAQLAARFLVDIGGDVYSSKQLVELLAQNPYMLGLCSKAVGRLDLQPGRAAVAAIRGATWRTLDLQAAKLHAALESSNGSASDPERPAAEATAHAVRSLHMATVLLRSTDAGALRPVLLEHAHSIAIVLHTAAAASGSLEADGKAASA
ncbi:hypothetical protein ABPG75_012001 [Micractinium tetrahymenae]